MPPANVFFMRANYFLSVIFEKSSNYMYNVSEKKVSCWLFCHDHTPSSPTNTMHIKFAKFTFGLLLTLQ